MGDDMTNFILVGGFWIGAWAWEEVVRELERRGHRAYPLDLPGLGERRGEGNGSVTLETHIADVVRFVEANDVRDVVLVGHSAGGAIVNVVAARIAERVAGLVFVDSGPVPEGATIADFQGPNGRDDMRRAAETHGEGWRLPLPPFEQMPPANLAGLDDAKLERFRAEAADEPLHVAIDPVRLDGKAFPEGRPRWAILCTMPRAMVDGQIAAGNPWFVPMSGPDWRFLELATGHWPMLSEPGRLAEMLASFPAG